MFYIFNIYEKLTFLFFKILIQSDNKLIIRTKYLQQIQFVQLIHIFYILLFVVLYGFMNKI